MNKIKFTVEDVEGDFYVDADALKDYKTLKQLTLADKNPAGMFEALERIYLGNDEEYIERVGGLDGLEKLNDAATKAAKAKKD